MDTGLYATLGRTRWPVSTWQQVSEAYLKLVRMAGTKHHHVPKCKIVNDAGIVIAIVARTGQVWSVDEPNSPAQALYTPRGRA